VSSPPVSIPTNGNALAIALCPTGSQLLSGGGEGLGLTVYATKSEPILAGSGGWLWVAHNYGAATTIDATALCLH